MPPRILNPANWRFRVRTLMLIVVVVALAIEGTRVGTRWSRYHKLARGWREQELSYLEVAHQSDSLASRREQESRAADGATAVSLRNKAKKDRRSSADWYDLADWASRLAAKYEEAQTQPWREASPDDQFSSRASRGIPYTK